jgi:hypothetical protein
MSLRCVKKDVNRPRRPCDKKTTLHVHVEYNIYIPESEKKSKRMDPDYDGNIINKENDSIFFLQTVSEKFLWHLYD